MNNRVATGMVSRKEKEINRMETKRKDHGAKLEANEHLCVSPKVIQLIQPEEVSVAVLRHLHGIEVEMIEIHESDVKKETDRHSYLLHRDERRSVHESIEGLMFYVTSDLQDCFINVTLPDEE
jgi:hypothetical protein